MLRFADFVLHDRSAAEDAVQEAFMIAYQRHGTLKDRTAFTAWLRTIVLRECLRWRRRRLFQVLGLGDRVIAYYEDLTLARIAAELRIPESTAKTRLYEALRRLQAALPGYGPSNTGEQA